MPTPKVHIFIGAGPANLDRALKIRKRDPTAEFIFLDKRVSREGKLDRERSRANIFRFPLSDKQSIIDNGVSRTNFEALSTERDFSEKEGFQAGDTAIFGGERFTQIQIRDLQQLYLNRLNRKPKPLFIPINVDISDFKKITDIESVNALILKSIQKELDVKDSFRLRQDQDHIDNLKSGFTCHVAAGALSEATTKDSMVYPAKSHPAYSPGLSPDLSAMPVTAMHGTTTFNLGDIRAESLVSKTKSLDDAAWQADLKALGWNLLRPPRVRLFYANDTLYVGTEVPAAFAALLDDNGQPTEEYKTKQAQFTRTIAQLMIPSMSSDIGQLIENKTGVNAPSYFLTSRGETGDVLNISDDSLVISHGDRRYLPHYQTGSGFLTATQQNEAYVDIYLKESFDSLYEWAKRTDHADKEKDEILKTYEKAVGKDNVLKAFQADLYTFVTRKILAENKIKVDKYFTKIQTQAVNILSEDRAFEELTEDFNATGNSLHADFHSKSLDSFPKAIRPIVMMEMLIHGNDNFLKKTLPKLMNVDISNLDLDKETDVKKLHQLRDSFSDDYVKYIDCKAIFYALDKDKQINLLRDILEHKSTGSVKIPSILSTLHICPSKQEDMGMLMKRFLDETSNTMQKLMTDYPDGDNKFIAFANEYIYNDSISEAKIKQIAKHLKDEFSAHPELRKTLSGWGIFKLKGRHAGKIDDFMKTMNDIGETGSKAELAKAVFKFQKDLCNNKSVRTSRVLENAFVTVGALGRPPDLTDSQTITPDNPP